MAQNSSQYNDFYLCEVRCLSRGKTFKRNFDLREEIETFLEEKEHWLLRSSKR